MHPHVHGTFTCKPVARAHLKHVSQKHSCRLLLHCKRLYVVAHLGTMVHDRAHNRICRSAWPLRS